MLHRTHHMEPGTVAEGQAEGAGEIVKITDGHARLGGGGIEREGADQVGRGRPCVETGCR